MNCLAELKSGKCGVYATWMSLASVVLLIIFSGTFFSLNPISWLFSICGWLKALTQVLPIYPRVEAFLIVLIEFPFCAKMYSQLRQV
jgi:hypothetical protein